jgi:hypothetical protein
MDLTKKIVFNKQIHPKIIHDKRKIFIKPSQSGCSIIQQDERKDIKTDILFVTVVIHRDMLDKVFPISVRERTFSEFLLVDYYDV